jgi:hypothetical protein
MVCFRYIILSILHKSDNKDTDNNKNNNDQLCRTIFNGPLPVTITLYSSSILGTVILVWFSVYILSYIKITVSQTFDISTVY